MKDITWIDNLTARLSYGELGNDSIGSYYAWQSFYDLTYANATNPGARVDHLLANPADRHGRRKALGTQVSKVHSSTRF